MHDVMDEGDYVDGYLENLQLVVFGKSSAKVVGCFMVFITNVPE